MNGNDFAKKAENKPNELRRESNHGFNEWTKNISEHTRKSIDVVEKMTDWIVTCCHDPSNRQKWEEHTEFQLKKYLCFT